MFTQELRVQDYPVSCSCIAAVYSRYSDGSETDDSGTFNGYYCSRGREGTKVVKTLKLTNRLHRMQVYRVPSLQKLPEAIATIVLAFLTAKVHCDVLFVAGCLR